MPTLQSSSIFAGAQISQFDVNAICRADVMARNFGAGPPAIPIDDFRAFVHQVQDYAVVEMARMEAELATRFSPVNFLVVNGSSNRRRARRDVHVSPGALIGASLLH